MSYSSDVDLPSVSQVELYIVAALLSVFAVVGTTGNALVLYVFSSKRDGLVSTLFIMVLAVVDLTTCMFIVPFTVVMELVAFRVDSDFVCKLYQFLITFNIPFSALVMAAIAVDRYLCICRPFWRLLNVARARWVVAVLALSAGCLGLGGSLTHGVYQLRSLTDGNVTMTTSSGQLLRGDDNIIVDDDGDTTDEPSMGVTPPFGQEGATVSDVDFQPATAEYKLENTGNCAPTDILISETAGLAFQKCYNGIFLGCLLVVSILYALIYRSVRQRRLWREKHKSTASIPTQPSSQKQRQLSVQAAAKHVDAVSLIEAPPVKTDVQRCMMMTTTTQMTAVDDEQSTVGCKGNPISAGNGRAMELDKAPPNGGPRGDGDDGDRMELMTHETAVGGRSRDKGSENGVERHAGAAEPTATTMTSDELGDKYSTFGYGTAAARNGNPQSAGPPANRNEGNALSYDRITEDERLNERLLNDDSRPSCGGIDESGSGPRHTAAPMDEVQTATKAAASPKAEAPLPVRVPSELDSGASMSTCTSRVQSATVTETVDVLPSCISATETKPKSSVAVVSAGTGSTTSANAATSLAAAQKNRIANVKTAAMLFVVTLVFVLTFMPALSMTVQLIPYNMTVFYMYFANNLANPIIYSFMNQNFRKQLKRLFGKRQQ